MYHHACVGAAAAPHPVSFRAGASGKRAGAASHSVNYTSVTAKAQLSISIFFFCMLSGFSSSMEQQGVSGVPSANQQDGSRQSASTAHQQTDPSVTLETLKAIMKRVAVEAIEESQRRTPASSLPPTTTTGKP